MNADRQQHGGHRLAEPADHRVVLGHHDQAAGAGAASRSIVAVSSGLMVGTCSTPTSTRSAASALAVSSARIVMMPDEMISTSVPSRSSFAFAEFELIVVLVEHDRHVAAQQRAYTPGPRWVGDGRHHLFDFDRVARIDHRQVRHRAEQREIFGRLVARTVAGGEAGQRADDLDVEVFLGDRLVDEVVGTAGGEHRVGGGERLNAFARHARTPRRYSSCSAMPIW